MSTTHHRPPSARKAPRPATPRDPDRSPLTVAQVAERYGVGVPTVLHWIDRGELRAVNVGRSATAKKPRWRITEAALTAFEAARTPTPPAPRRRRSPAGADVIRFY